MTTDARLSFRAALLCCTLLLAPVAAFAAQGDCGQPQSTGSSPNISDALTILKSAVDTPTVCDKKPCICDVSGDGKTATSDALLVLKHAVGLPVALTCLCEFGPPCTSARFETRAGSRLDVGWTGIAHDSQLLVGASVDVRILRRCTDNDAPCVRNADCGSGNCQPTCDCGNDMTCEITGPSEPRRCAFSLASCQRNRCLGGSGEGNACSNDTDCPDGSCGGSSSCTSAEACVLPAGPPLPLSYGGTPLCVTSNYEGLLTGTANAATGEGVASANLRSRVHLGVAADQPCPRCGQPAQHPAVGQQFTCEGGASDGNACRVDGVSPEFGGTSFDCPPSEGSNITGTGISTRLREITTGTTTKTAQLPCANFALKGNPLSEGSNPKCTDRIGAEDPVCTSNADCRRCSGDSTIACAGDGDCSGHGTCAEAPDQPITCGYWCSCGFCGGNASLPCFVDGDCGEGVSCEAGTGIGTEADVPQQKPNDCSGDKFVCGQAADEQCATTKSGSCTLEPWRACSDNSDCPEGNAGTCELVPRSCFEPRITRSGSPSPVGKYCATGPGVDCNSNTDCLRCSDNEESACATNADCGEGGACGPSVCVADAARPRAVALFCSPATSSSSINAVTGITGPGALSLNTLVKICRCGDSIAGCDEQCDDGNTVPGDGCDEWCQIE